MKFEQRSAAGTLTSDQLWGVMLEFKEVCPEGFAQLIAAAPDSVEWMG
ncbi:MAG: hypothetical protein MET45_28855 [Nostoc sp. LLA-1]|nr:hypothetical protein [Cyanocohniella sp. LLY]